MDNHVFRDPAEKQADLWRVQYAGAILPTEFTSRGAAQIHLDRCVAAGRALA